jgi:cation diffusion facilitator CzcD-associated flavoprotein CzcO
MTVREVSASVTAPEIFTAWLERFAAAMERRDADGVLRFFDPESHWKDILSFTWEHRTFSGLNAIRSALESALLIAEPCNIRVAEGRTRPYQIRRTAKTVIEAYFDFDTKVGKGTAFVRLLHNDADPLNPRIWLLLTTLQALHGFEEKTGRRRPTGDEYSKNVTAENWLDDRNKEQRFIDRDPEVLIVGAGQAGLILAARLRQMGVDALVIDKMARVGDVWRQRYHSLTLHNGITANHMPYMPFPETWPVWLPKDMLAGWLESYASFLELNVWTETNLEKADFNQDLKNWTIRLKCSDGSERRMTCKHLVVATGVSGSVPHVPEIPGLEEFKGTVIHSSEFEKGGRYVGKRAIVVGAGNSGHDVAQDLHVNGAGKVWMLQRGPTCLVSLNPSAKMVYAIYDEGRPIEDVDLISAAVPYPVMKDTYRWITKKSAELDKELLEGVHAAGFETYFGDDDTGFQMMYLRGQGGYYINVGCSELIADGKVGVLQTRNMDRFVEGGLRMSDGSTIECDLVVLATGFKNMQEGIRELVGDDVADRLGTVWGFDDDHAMKNMWRQTVQEGLWITGGALLDARLYSRFLAIEIKAALEGILPRKSQLPLVKRTASRSPDLAAV